MTAPRPVLLQLWTVRKELEKDFGGTVSAVASLGYDGVEPFNNKAVPPAVQARVYERAGLKVPTAHLSLPQGDTLRESLDAAEALGVNWIVSGFGPEAFTDLEATRQTADRANEAAANARGAGYGFALHNHWWEFEGAVWEQFLPLLEDSVHLELDTYWAQVAGHDPVKLLTDLGPRVPLVHLKDGPAIPQEPMLALGDGVMDVPGVVAAAEADYLIVELDEFAGDMLDAVARSLLFLRGLQGH